MVCFLLFGSCTINNRLIYIDSIGDCYPTQRNIQNMYNQRSITGADYVWYDCQWLTRTQRDSVFQFKYDSFWKEHLQQYDSISNKIPNHQ